MKFRTKVRVLPVTLGAALSMIAAGVAQASLGGDVDSVLKDHQVLRASHTVRPMSHYVLHEGTTADGLLLREFVDHSGKVFAVSWSGSRSPDLSRLLGDHAERFQRAARAHRGTRHVLTLNEPGLVVSVMRLPRGWLGQAYLPSAIPAGVSRDELQ